MYNPDVWTETRISQLKVFIVEENKSASQAADAFYTMGFRVSRNAIVGKMWRLNLKSKYSINHPRAVKVRAIKEKVPRPPKEAKSPKLLVDPLPSMAALENAPEPLRTSLLDLTSSQCRWALDEKDKHGLMLFCGHFAADGRWCDHHLARCNTPARHHGRAA